MGQLAVEHLHSSNVGVVGTVIAGQAHELRLAVSQLLTSVDGKPTDVRYVPKFEEPGTLTVNVPPSSYVPQGTTLNSLIGQQVIVAGPPPTGGNMTAIAVLPVGSTAPSANHPSTSPSASTAIAPPLQLMDDPMILAGPSPSATPTNPNSILANFGTGKVGLGEWGFSNQPGWDVPAQLLGVIGNPCGAKLTLNADGRIGLVVDIEFPVELSLSRDAAGNFVLDAIPRAGTSSSPTVYGFGGLAVGINLHVVYPCLNNLNFDIGTTAIPIVTRFTVSPTVGLWMTDAAPPQGQTAEPTPKCYQAGFGFPKTPLEVGIAICLRVDIHGAPIGITLLTRGTGVVAATAPNRLLLRPDQPLPIDPVILSYSPTFFYTVEMGKTIGAGASKVDASIDTGMYDIYPVLPVIKIPKTLAAGPIRIGSAASLPPMPASIPAPYIGTWTGTFYQEVAPIGPYPMSLTLHDGTVGTDIGSTSYPTLACNGALTLTEIGDQSVTVAEHIVTPNTNCIDSTHNLAVSGQTLKVEWTDPRTGMRGGYATLTRASSAPPDSKSIPAAYIGTWTGTFSQESAPVGSYPMTLTLHAGAVGAEIGSTSYPTLACDGVLTLNVVGNQSVTVAEHIVTPNTNCIDGSHTLTVSGQTLKVEWTDPRTGTRGGYATLTRANS